MSLRKLYSKLLRVEKKLKESGMLPESTEEGKEELHLHQEMLLQWMAEQMNKGRKYKS